AAGRALSGGVTLPQTLTDALNAAVGAGLTAGAATFRTQASACVTDAAFTQMSQLRDKLGCIGTAARTAFAAGSVAAVRSALRTLIAGVTSRATQTEIQGLVRTAGLALSGGVTLPQTLTDALNAAVGAGLTAGAATFRTQ